MTKISYKNKVMVAKRLKIREFLEEGFGRHDMERPKKCK